jgi:hypothetical protein
MDQASADSMFLASPIVPASIRFQGIFLVANQCWKNEAGQTCRAFEEIRTQTDILTLRRTPLAGPFCSYSMDEDHLWRAARYIDLNPIAGIGGVR